MIKSKEAKVTQSILRRKSQEQGRSWHVCVGGWVGSGKLYLEKVYTNKILKVGIRLSYEIASSQPKREFMIIF